MTDSAEEPPQSESPGEGALDFGLDAIQGEPVPLPEEFRREVEAKRTAEAVRIVAAQARGKRRRIFGAILGAGCALITAWVMGTSSLVFYALMCFGGGGLALAVVWRRHSAPAGALIYGAPLLLLVLAGYGLSTSFGWRLVSSSPYLFFPATVVFSVAGAFLAIWRSTEE